MKHILDYRGFAIFKLSSKEYAVKIDTPDGLISLGQPFKTCLEALVAINRDFKPSPLPQIKRTGIRKFLIDFFNISA